MTIRLQILLIGLLASFIMESLGQQSQPPAGIIAKAGDTYITETEFLERFEMLPGLQRHRTERMEEAKLELLYSLIAEKLLAQEARERRIDQDSIVRLSFEEIRKMLARDQLYRLEVSGKVHVTPKDVAEAIDQALKEVLVSFIFCERKDDAEFIRKQIRTAKEFGSIEIDISLHSVRDTATIIWSDATPAIEQAAYALRKGEVSPVIQSGGGFYILKVERIQSNAFYTSLQSTVLRERVEGKVRLRKEESRLNEFVAAMLRNRTGYSKPGPLRELVGTLKQVYAKVRVVGRVALNDNMLSQARSICRLVLHDTLAVAGNAAWTVEEILERLHTRGFSLDSVTVKAIPQQVNGLLRVWVQQELLAQEALARGLDTYPAVRQQLDTWHDNVLEQSMRFYLKKQVKVSEAEVLSFLRSKDSSVVIPRVQLRELITASLDEMHQALDEIQTGKSMEEVIIRWCSDAYLRERKGISDPFPVSDRYPVGEIAWQMIVGQRYGPVKEGSGYLYFELLSKDPQKEPVDTGFTERMDRAKNELLRQKEKRLVNLFLAQAGQSRGYSIYQDRLSRIKASPIPMMTFRILGFGGRMFAVPFVDRQIEWLNVEPPQGQIAF
ncbi:MAG: peptidylprolyl isomerase [Ignavibacteriales bacterium]|nr:peptidylprolyl isomerase [Ignavibacteriales bacterium]